MVPRLPRLASALLLLLIAAARTTAMPLADQTDPLIEYRVDKMSDGRDLARFGGPEIALLEKLNRADAKHLARLPMIVLPSAWGDEMSHSPFPETYAAAVAVAKLIVVDQPSQAFAAYENGKLVRWGPVSSGRQAKPTPSGLFHLNWRARTRTSTLSGEWRLNWYFNFHNRRGLAFHEFDLPGVPQSHACVRLLSRDAEWIYKWGESWTLDDKQQMKTTGTPVLIVGSFAFGKPAPWQAPDYWTRKISLPEALPAQ